MRFTRFTRRKARACALGVTLGVLLVVAGSFAGASGAGSAAATSAAVAGYPAAGPDEVWAWQKFLAPTEADVHTLSSLGVDVNEGTTKNPDGSASVSVRVTKQQRAYLEALGFRAGDVVQTSADVEQVRSEMVATALAERDSLRAAKTGKAVKRKRFLAAETLKVTRADYYQSYSGTWISVEAKTSAVQGSALVTGTWPGSQAGSCYGSVAGGATANTQAAVPTLSVMYSTNGGSTYQPGFQTAMSCFVDDGVYLYHRVLIKLAVFANNDTTAPKLPIKVRVASSLGGIGTRDAAEFAGTPAAFGPTFQRDFFTRYQTPQDGQAFIQQLNTERPDITHLIDLPFKTNGYRRHSMASIGCSVATVGGNANVGGGSPTVGASPSGFATPSTCSTAQQASAVMLEAKGWGGGDPDSNLITYQVKDPAPLAASLPLTVSVAGTAITVTRATNAAGAVDTTSAGPNSAANVVLALNANPDVSALLTARRWGQSYTGTTGGNAGATAVGVNASPIALSDFLFAPKIGDGAFPAGFQVARAPFQLKVLRICKVCDGSKPGFFVFAEEHAREWVSPLVSLETAGRLVRNYGTDLETTAFVDNLDIFVLPTENPDGSNNSLLQGGAASQRKNMTQYCGTTPGVASSTGWDAAGSRATPGWGVDVNRNFSVGSVFDGYEGATSTSCTSETYSGPSGFSEPEVKNEVWVLDTYPNIRFSMNIHTSGGYFMWSPASYKTVGRIALPYATKGWEETFWSTGKKVIDRIKQVRGTVVPPARTGPVVDVLYSAAGNSSDEYWYNHNIISYDFECGVDRYDPTSTGAGGISSPGFQPNFASEGRAEGQEFASGMYGLMSAALDYANDVTAPVITPTVPSGTVSMTPIALQLNESEPADIYYTTDGSTPTLASPTYVTTGFRELDGQTLTFTQNTTLKYFAVDPKGNTSALQTATYVVDSVAPTTTASVSNGSVTNQAVTLTATDDNSGVAATYYTVDGGSQQTYTAPFTLADGHHSLTYWSVDVAGNIEATHTVADFAVDTVAPVTSATTSPAAPDGANGWFLGPVTVTLSATDATGGVATTWYTIDGGPTQTYTGPFVISSAGTHTVKYWSSDNGGNVEVDPSTVIKIDLAAPVTTATLSPAIHNGWYASPTLTLSGTDDASGVAHIDYSRDGGPWTLYSAPLGSFSTGNHFVQYRATDNAGRIEGIQTIAFKADSVKPSVNITKPAEGAVYVLDKPVAAAFKCTDNGAGQSGLDSCVGTVANGANIDTSTIGAKTFTVTGTDKAGNVTTVTSHYTVVYTFNGFNNPITNTETSKLNLVHAGDLIKIGFGLNGDRGLSIGTFSSTDIPCPAWTPHSVPAAGAGSTAGLSYGVASGHYTYGWQTSAAWGSTCRRLSLQLNDGSAPHTADFMFFS